MMHVAWLKLGFLNVKRNTCKVYVMQGAVFLKQWAPPLSWKLLRFHEITKTDQRLQTDDGSLVTVATDDLASQSLSPSALGFVWFFCWFFLLLAMVMWCGRLKSGAVSTVGFGRVTFAAGIKELLGTYIVTGVDYYWVFFYRRFRFLMILHQAQNFIDQRQRGSGLRKEVFMDEWNHWWGNTALMGQWMISHVR